jgi:hypothetical protein
VCASVRNESHDLAGVLDNNTSNNLKIVNEYDKYVVSSDIIPSNYFSREAFYVNNLFSLYSFLVYLLKRKISFLKESDFLFLKFLVNA